MAENETAGEDTAKKKKKDKKKDKKSKKHADEDPAAREERKRLKREKREKKKARKEKRAREGKESEGGKKKGKEGTEKKDKKKKKAAETKEAETEEVAETGEKTEQTEDGAEAEPADEDDDQAVTRKKRRTEDEDEEKDDDDDEDDEAALENLPELQREAALYDRQQKRKAKAERAEAKKKLKSEQRTRSTREVKPAISKALQAYVAQKDGKEDEDKNASTDEEAVQKAESSDDEPIPTLEDERRKAKEEAKYAEGDEEVEVEVERNELQAKHVVGMQVRRTALEKIFFEPFFAEYVKGKFVRVNVGERADNQQNAYRLAVVKDVASYPTPYKFGGRQTKVALLVKHGKAERIFAMSVISNSSTTEGEFERWKKEMTRCGEDIMPYEFALNDMRDAEHLRLGYTYSSADIQTMLEKKKKDTLRSFNLTAERNKLHNAKMMAQEDGNQAEVARLQADLEKLDEEEGMLRRRRQAHKSGLVDLNIRNKKKNLEAKEELHKELNKQERVTGKGFQDEDYYSTKMTLPAPIWTAESKRLEQKEKFDKSQTELKDKRMAMIEASRVRREPKAAVLCLTDTVETPKPEEKHIVKLSVSPSDLAYDNLAKQHSETPIELEQTRSRPKPVVMLQRVPLGTFSRTRSLEDYLRERDSMIKD